MEWNRKSGFDPTKSPYVLMPLLLIMWGSLSAVSKLLLGALDPYQVMFYMYGLGIIMFAAVLLMKSSWNWKEFRGTKDLVLLMSCGLLTFLYDFFYLKALELVPAVEASMLNYLFPIFIVWFAIPIHGERMTVAKGVSMLMGLAGTWLLVTKGDWTSISLTNWKGDLYAVLAAVCWGLFTNLVKKNSRDMLYSTIVVTATAFVLSTVTLVLFSGWILPRGGDFYGVFWLSFSNIVMGFFLYFRALQYSPASFIASFTFFTPFVTLVFIMVLLGERMTMIDLAAAGLILFSVPIQRIGGWWSWMRIRWSR